MLKMRENEGKRREREEKKGKRERSTEERPATPISVSKFSMTPLQPPPGDLSRSEVQHQVHGSHLVNLAGVTANLLLKCDQRLQALE